MITRTGATSVRRQMFESGSSLIEVMVSLVILVVGLLGLAGLQAKSHEMRIESFSRAQAMLLVQDMSDRLLANLANARTGQYAVNAAGAPASGLCPTADPPTTVGEDLCDWHTALRGAAEQVGGTAIGALSNARGCVEWDGANNLYTVSVAWQGRGDFGAPAVNCGSADILVNRRALSGRIRIATLTSTIGGP